MPGVKLSDLFGLTEADYKDAVKVVRSAIMVSNGYDEAIALLGMAEQEPPTRRLMLVGFLMGRYFGREEGSPI